MVVRWLTSKNIEPNYEQIRPLEIIIIFLYFLSPIHAVGTFESLCAYPFFYGRGTLKGTKCDVEYYMDTSDDLKAYDMCATLSPFEITYYKFGYPTLCTYVKTHFCEDSELTLYDKCIVVKGFAEYGSSGCGDRYKMHNIEHREEQKWITVLLESTIAEVWIANINEGAKFLNPRFDKGTKGIGTEQMKVTLRIQGDSFGSYLRGTAFYEHMSKNLPHLCSKPARASEATILEISNMFETLGFQGGIAKDRKGNARPFLFFPSMMPVKGGKFDPKFDELHETCQLLPNGYAASLYDFLSVDAFISARAGLPAGLYRASVGRIPSFSSDPSSDCSLDKDYKANRKRWTYYGPKNSTAISDDKYWSDKYPANTCADLPRTTVGLLNHYVDIPAFVRRPIICTYGNPPDLPPLRPDDQCNRAAHFDHNKQRCVCNDPSADGKIKDPEKYGKFPEGVICIDCTSTTITRSIMFVLDNTGSVGHDGWAQQKDFMRKVAESIKNVRMGLVIIAADPNIEIEIDYYNKNKEKVWNFIKHKRWGNRWTGIGPALRLARLSLEVLLYPFIAFVYKSIKLLF
ncbi:hypothetical protein RB195_011622 [Necator americanus]|uniref:VWFA domain-containing protein n=1 Tax=Necator americanus TaxID=51031 RepID=A0ABR1D393_NECAM